MRMSLRWSPRNGAAGRGFEMWTRLMTSRFARSGAQAIGMMILSVACAAPAGSAQAALSCQVQTEAVVFPSYKATQAAPTDGSGAIEMRCTCSGLDCLAFGYSLEIQSGSSGSVTDRRLRRTGGAETLRYGLFRDALRQSPWGVGANALGGLYLLSNFGT